MSQSDLFAFDQAGTDDAFSLHDRIPDGDLGNPDRITWTQRTRVLLKDKNFLFGLASNFS